MDVQDYVLIGIVLIFFGPLIFLSITPPNKLELGSNWGNWFEDEKSASVWFRKFDLVDIPFMEYRNCFLIESERNKKLHTFVDIRDQIQVKSDLSDHTVLVAAIEYPDKYQWLLYSARPGRFKSLLKEFEIPNVITWGKLIDPRWEEYIDHAKTA